MIWRWIIRSIGIAPVALCAIVWAASYFQMVTVSYENKTHFWYTSLAKGTFTKTDGKGTLTGHLGWWVWHGPYDPRRLGPSRSMNNSIKFHFLGFLWDPSSNPNGPQILELPLWFPTALTAAFFGLVWRKSRPKYNGKGFPVVLNAKAAKP